MTARALLYCAGGGLGDSLVASVVARALHEKFERVDALTLPGHRATLERVPDVDGVLVDEGGDEARLAADLQERGYAASVVTWATARTARVPQLAKIPVRVGQARRLYSFRFTDRVTVRSELGDVTTPWAEILLDYARVLGCDTLDSVPRFVPDARDAESAETVARDVLDGRDFVLLHPANAVAAKRGFWPTQGWAALANALAERFGSLVAISGITADRQIAGEILARTNRASVRSVAGLTDIGGFGALAQRAKAFVGITTGPMHVAAAVGAPTVGIFPFQTDYPERWAPLGARTAVVRATYPCRPGETKETCPDYACIANLDVDNIVATTAALIDSGVVRR
ncbi:MAG: glycosyltransferase family 9 protein [Vulcanimicrobiaceae bacterium]